MRILLPFAILIALVALIYFILERRRPSAAQSGAANDALGENNAESENTPSKAPDKHWPLPFKILLAALALTFIGVLAQHTFETQSPPHKVYEPARTENGKIIPGRMY